MSYFSKGLSDSLVQASSSILKSEPEYSVGDSVTVNNGPNTGKDGRVVGIKSSGYSDVQLTHGRHITIANEHLGSSTNILSEKKSLDPVDKKALKKKFSKRADDGDADIDNDGDEDESDRYLHKKRQAIGKNIKKNKKSKEKNGEDVEIDPTLDEIQNHQRQANAIQSSRALSLIKGIIGNR